MSKRMDGALKLLIGYVESGVEVQDAVYKTVEALNLSSTEITRLVVKVCEFYTHD